MLKEKTIWKTKIAQTLNEMLRTANIDVEISTDKIAAEIPPNAEMGDLGFPMFPFAKMFKKAPPAIAASVAEILSQGTLHGESSCLVFAVGPYVNIKLDRSETSKQILEDVLAESESCCVSKFLKGKRIMVEFSSPNTNKPLHLGHLRNDVLGESISRILAACGADVQKVCIINDRGIHICKSMLAYIEKFSGKTPQSENKKSDRFVGDCYVEFDKMSKQEEAENASVEKNAKERAQDLLLKWEAGDADVTALWKTMNDWTVNGIKETYKRTGVSFDKFYFESKTYLRGKEEVQKGLEKNIFYKETDGSVWADLSADNLDKKALLRKDGTSLYITQDFGTAILRHDDWPFDRLVYVVGNEQRYHFSVLFKLLERLGFVWAKDLYHLAYGMVNLPNGRMKSREGTVVDADDLIDELRDMALEEIKQKEREEEVGNAACAAEKIALGALHYYLLQITPDKDMLFNPEESLSFNGNTGPYLQYMGARICSILRQEKAKQFDYKSADLALLTSDAEWELIKTISTWQEVLNDAADKMNPSIITAWLYDLSKKFSTFYHICPILNADDGGITCARLALCKAVLAALKNALHLVCIPFLEVM
ncbi:MAG: arginine--tRNA ligase [Termitinemataceae bacterium]|nr:MAG: arginine--tRNA ligase [Termitinemataceae bacterium]